MNDGRGGRKSGEAFADIAQGFGGILDSLGDALSEISQRLEDGQSGEVHRSYDVDTGRGPVRAEAGIRVRFAGQTMSAKEDHAEPVNRPKAKAIKPSPAAATELPPRTVDVDILEDETSWRLTADLPGVSQEELSLSVANGVLTIETTGARRYLATVQMPDGQALDALELRLTNGILDLQLSKNEGR